jgi:hypothetical protein
MSHRFVNMPRRQSRVARYTKTYNFGTFWKALKWKILAQFIVILWAFCTFGCLGYIFPPFGMLYLEKSGNPATKPTVDAAWRAVWRTSRSPRRIIFSPLN